MELVLDALRAEYDLVIVDTPPVLAITDALLVGKHTEGVIIVCRMRRTTRSGLRRALEAVERVHARTLGVVINATVEPIDKRYGYANNYISNEREQNESDLHPTEAHASGMAQAYEPPTPPYEPAAQTYEPEPDVVPFAAEQPAAQNYEPEPDVVPFPAEEPAAQSTPPVSPAPPGYPQQPVPPPTAWQSAPLWPAVPQQNGAGWPPAGAPNGPANGTGYPSATEPSHGAMGSRRDRRAAAGGRRRRSRSGQGDSQ
jgi:hypothetical protein